MKKLNQNEIQILKKAKKLGIQTLQISEVDTFNYDRLDSYIKSISSKIYLLLRDYPILDELNFASQIKVSLYISLVKRALQDHNKFITNPDKLYFVYSHKINGDNFYDYFHIFSEFNDKLQTQMPLLMSTFQNAQEQVDEYLTLLESTFNQNSTSPATTTNNHIQSSELKVLSSQESSNTSMIKDLTTITIQSSDLNKPSYNLKSKK